MSIHATATFEVKAWEEKPYDEIDEGPKLTRASVTKSFSGDIEGEGTVEYLMIHRDDGSASFVGLERVVGRVGDRSGSFVLQHTGTFEGARRRPPGSSCRGRAPGTCVACAARVASLPRTRSATPSHSTTTSSDAPDTLAHFIHRAETSEVENAIVRDNDTMSLSDSGM